MFIIIIIINYAAYGRYLCSIDTNLKLYVSPDITAPKKLRERTYLDTPDISLVQVSLPSFVSFA